MVLYGKFSQPYSQYPVQARAYVRSRLSLALTLSRILFERGLQTEPSIPCLILHKQTEASFIMSFMLQNLGLRINMDKFAFPTLRNLPNMPRPHLFRANTIRFLDKTFAKQHLTPQNGPKNYPQK